MSAPIVKATLPAAADLLLRWFKHELNDKTVRSETQKFLEACGKIKPLGEALAEMRANGEKPSTAVGIEVLTRIFHGFYCGLRDLMRCDRRYYLVAV